MARTPFPFSLNELRVTVQRRAWPSRRGALIAQPSRGGRAGRVAPFGSELEPLERRIGYRFRDRGLLEHALTHRSRVHEDASGGVIDNESLEFLGDSVLGFIIADRLFRTFPQHNEGQKSKLKASLVSAASLARLGEQLGLGEFLILGRGEEKTGGRRKQALIADGYEALIAAIYLDGGVERGAHVSRPAVRRPDCRGAADRRARRRSPRTTSPRCRSGCRRAVAACRSYRLVGESGPPHHRLFEVEVLVGGEGVARAEGRSKKEAAQAAAQARARSAGALSATLSASRPANPPVEPRGPSNGRTPRTVRTCRTEAITLNRSQ